MEDEEIIASLFQRDEAAIQMLAGKYGHYLHTVAYNILQSKEDSEEAVNDSYLAAWNSIPPNRPDILSLYLARVTRHIAIDIFRKRKSKKRIPSENISPLEELNECTSMTRTMDSEAEKEELGRAISRFLYLQKETARTIFVLRYWYSCSIREIAEKTGFTESKIKNMLSRQRKALRSHLKKEGILL